MNTTHSLKTHPRPRLGSRYSARERAAGRLPAVVYGHGRDPVSISLDAKEALKHIRAGEKVFSLELPGEGSQTVILKDLQFDYLGTNVIHADMARVDLNETIEVHVPIRLVGEAIGLKKAGAILTHPMSTLSVMCKVKDVPDFIDVPIADLDLDQTIHARDVKLPEGFELVTDDDAVVAAISAVKEQVVVAEAAAVGTEAAQPEVITEKKKEGEGAKDAKDAKGDKKA